MFLRLVVTVSMFALLAACESAPACVVEPQEPTAPTEPRPPEIPWLADDGTESLGIVPPAPPMPPVFTPCPTGWVETDSDGVTVCEPWVDGVDGASCASHRMVQIGVGCVDVGIACESGSFRSDAPTGAVFVEEGATGGDGSAATPFATIEEALSGATGATTLVLAAGRYALPTTLGGDVSVLGHCSSATTLVLPTGGTDVAIARLEDVGIEGSGEELRASATDASLHIEGALVGDGVGLRVTDGSLEVVGSLIRGIAPRGGAAVRASGGRLLFDRSATRSLVGAAIDASASATVEVRDSAFSGTNGPALQLSGGATATFERSTVEGSRGEALVARQEGTSLDVSRSVVRGTRQNAGTLGVGLRANDRAVVTSSQVWFVDNGGASIHLEGDAMFETSDALFEGGADAHVVIGVISVSSSGSFERVTVRDTSRHGLALESSATELTDVHIVGNGILGEETDPFAIYLQGESSSFGATRVLIDGYRFRGIETDGTTELSDVTVHGGIPRFPDAGEAIRGDPFAIISYGVLNATRVATAERVNLNGDVVLTEATLEAFRSNGGDGETGAGGGEGQVSISRAQLGFVFFHGGALRMEDAIVDGRFDIDARRLIVRRSWIRTSSYLWVGRSSVFGTGELSQPGFTIEDTVFRGEAGEDAMGLRVKSYSGPVSFERVLFDRVVQPAEYPQLELGTRLGFFINHAVAITGARSLSLLDVELRQAQWGLSIDGSDSLREMQLERVLVDAREGAVDCGLDIFWITPRDEALEMSLHAEVRGWPTGVCFPRLSCELRDPGMLRLSGNEEDIRW